MIKRKNLNQALLKPSTSMLMEHSVKKINILLIPVLLVILFVLPQLFAGQNQSPAGQQEEIAGPELFLPGVVSTHLAERDAALSADGQAFYYTVTSYRHPVIVFTRKQGQQWSKPQVAPFSGVYSDLEPHFSADGKSLYFASNRPLKEGDPVKDYDIWVVRKQQDGWGKPQNLDVPVNTKANEFYPSITSEGTLYWTSISSEGFGGEDIFYSELLEGEYRIATVLSDSINTSADEYNAYIARDGSYLIFSSTGWGKGEGSGDLYISFRKGDDTWTQAINMGPEVNSPSFDFCPFVSEDGRELFFTSNRTGEEVLPSPVTYKDILKYAASPYNKQHSIYVMDASIIEKLKEKTGLHQVD